MIITESKGYKKLRDAVERDIQDQLEMTKRQNRPFSCQFNEGGCNNPDCRCFHKYCDKFKWIIDRVNHYAEKLNIPAAEILDNWEEQREYWYMNFYQECKQPLLDKAGKVYIFETNEDVVKSFDSKGFRCPNCKGVSSHPQICDSKKVVNKKVCNWKSFGLFRLDLVTVVVKKPFSVTEIFKPINWEFSSPLKE